MSLLVLFGSGSNINPPIPPPEPSPVPHIPPPTVFSSSNQTFTSLELYGDQADFIGLPSKFPFDEQTWAFCYTSYVPCNIAIEKVEIGTHPWGPGELVITAISVDNKNININFINGLPRRLYFLKFKLSLSNKTKVEFVATLYCKPEYFTQAMAPVIQRPYWQFNFAASWPFIYNGLKANGSVLTLVDTTGWPTSTENLLPGDAWANGIDINIVPGLEPILGVPMFYGVSTAFQFLKFGGKYLPKIDPGIKGQIWLNGTVVCISDGLLTGLGSNGSFVIVTDTTDWPTSSEGLPLGAVFLNGIFPNAVGGSTPFRNAPPVFHDVLTSRELLVFGARPLPIIDPQVKKQIWLNGVGICISES
jgi:hypothetical protein